MAWEKNKPVGTDLLTNSHAQIRANWAALELGWLDLIANGTRTGGATFTIAGDFTAVIQAGDKIKLTDTTVKDSIILITPTFGAGVTTITLRDSILVGNPSVICFSKFQNPQGTNSQMAGWEAVTETWAYDSATTITVPTDATTKYSAGMKIKITQATGGTKYFNITIVAATLLTVASPNGAVVNNEAISNPCFSMMSQPFGYPPTKWDSGWFAVASSTSYTKNHNLGVIPSKILNFWSDQANGSGYQTLAQVVTRENVGQDGGTNVTSVTTTQVTIHTCDAGTKFTSFYIDTAGGLGASMTGYCRIICEV